MTATSPKAETTRGSAFVHHFRRFVEASFGEYVLVGLYAALLALYLRPNIFVDDAAITFRYVERFTTGHGFTYNDHERVLGTSSPLYALGLSLITLVGADVETGATALALLAFVASTILAAHLTTRLSGSRVAGTVAGLLLATDPFYRYQCLSGMESGLAVVLGLLTVVALLNERETVAGIILGLAVWNKLDAALLALALTVALLGYRRRSLLRIAAVSAAVVLPWALFALFYYGSPVPHSFIAKLHLQPVTKAFDHFWIWSFLLGNDRVLFPALAVASLGLLRPLGFGPCERVGAVTLGAWFLLHFLVLSAMSLGDYYPWYLTVLIPPTVILGCTLGGRLLARGAGTPYQAPIAAGLVLLLWLGGKGVASATWGDLTARNPIKSWEAFDDDRRLAGIFLGQYAEPHEVLSSAYGWPAFSSGMRVNDISLLNSKNMVQPVAYMVEHGVPADRGSHGPRVPGGFIPLATFNLTSDLYPGFGWFTLFGRPESSIARVGARYLQYRLFELPAPTPYSTESGLGHIQIAETDLLAHPPSGASFFVANAHQPAHVVFTPAFAPAVARDKTDGVTFELRLEDRLLYRRHVVATEREQQVILEVPDAESQERLKISFITGPGPRGDTTYDWAIWKSVKVVVGDAFIDLWKLRNQKMMEAWARYNPIGVSSRSDQHARHIGARAD